MDIASLPGEETIMESWGMIFGWRMLKNSYNSDKQKARYSCDYCHRKLNYEDPSFEKHEDYCCYHPTNHGRSNADPRSTASPVTIIKRDIGMEYVFILDYREHIVTESIKGQQGDPVVQLYDDARAMKNNDIAPNRGVRGKHQAHQLGLGNVAAEDNSPVFAHPTDGSRFNFNSYDLGIKEMMNYWDKHENINKWQFFELCGICQQNRAAHRLEPACKTCGQGPVCQSCFLKLVNDADDICKECNRLVEGAILHQGLFDPKVWILE